MQLEHKTQVDIATGKTKDDLISQSLALYFLMIDHGMEAKPGTLDSLKEAIRDRNIYFFDKEGEPSGFVTWYFDDKDLVVNNLCLFESGIHKLYELRKFFHMKYPNLTKVKWHDDKKQKDMIYGLK